MFDSQAPDALFEASMKVFGVPPGADLMNANVLLPWSHLPDYVMKETGRRVTHPDLERMAQDDWFRVGETAGENGDERGVMMIVPSRIGLLLDLKEHRWDADEIGAVGRYEDEMIEWVFAADELAYDNTPGETLARFFESEAGMFEEEANRANAGEWSDLESIFRIRDIDGEPDAARALEVAAQCRRRADRYRQVDPEDLPAERKESLLRLAYRVAFRNDFIRVMLVDKDRRQVRHGYSPFMVFEHESWGPDEHYEVGRVIWKATICNPWVLERESPTIRVPGLALRGSQVELTDGPSPTEYERLFKQYDIGTYLSEWATVTDARVCQHCFSSLPAAADSRRRYCSDSCRNAAKQARYRDRHPGRVFDAQARYYRQFDSDS